MLTSKSIIHKSSGHKLRDMHTPKANFETLKQYLPKVKSTSAPYLIVAPPFPIIPPQTAFGTMSLTWLVF